MEKGFVFEDFDLVTPDGKIEKISKKSSNKISCIVFIEKISPLFKGFDIDKDCVHFNLKSTLAQIGLDATLKYIELNQKKFCAKVHIELNPIGKIALSFLKLLKKGAFIGKLFARDPRRKVRDPDYLLRMFGRADNLGRPLLSLGGGYGRSDFVLEKIEGKTIAFLSLKDGVIKYKPSILSFLPTLETALHHLDFSTRKLLSLHQVFVEKERKIVKERHILLVKTAPLHIRTAFAKIADSQLPKGYFHTSANVLQPDTYASGDVYEFSGKSNQVLDNIPLEFYTLEPHKEHVFFEDRDQLQADLENPKILFQIFKKMPKKKNFPAATFIVKGEQIRQLTEENWIVKDPERHDFPGISHPLRQAAIVEKYIEQQPAYPFLKAIEEQQITSQGVLFTRFFPTPLLKRLLLNSSVHRCLKRIYFQKPSGTFGDFFSYEDRAFLVDLAKFGIPVFWIDHVTKKILQYVLKPEKDTGMFVPLDLIEKFRKATVFGVYGSNLQKGAFEKELKKLLEGVLKLKNQTNHSFLNQKTPIALLTGGGPGAMEVGNRVARSLNILSCANIVDFRTTKKSVVNEQKINPFVDAKMTYRLDHLVERQAEFHLDFPIFLPGGIGMDFEYTLEEVRRKTGASLATPVILFGSFDYWKKKITSRFQCNLNTGTIKGSEWVSNCFYCVQKASQALLVYRKFFHEKLQIGKKGPVYKEGFCNVKSHMTS